jgi:hypothetical protein
MEPNQTSWIVAAYGAVSAAVAPAWNLIVSRDFAVNFFANLGGALAGVLLAFWIERRIARRSAARLYGHVLLSVRSELSFLRPMCLILRDKLRTGDTAMRLSVILPATRAAVVNPLVHERAPYSLLVILTGLVTYTNLADESLRDGMKLIEERLFVTPPGPVDRIAQRMERDADLVQEMLGYVLEQIQAELTRLKLAALRPDTEAVAVIQGMQDILRR